jgi:hypothetical protein
MFTQDELVITQAFKELFPWKGSYEVRMDKWQTYLSNLCAVNRIKVIPKLMVPINILEQLAWKTGHQLDPAMIVIKTLSVQDLLFHFYCYKSQLVGNEIIDQNKAIEYSTGLFYSVWPHKIENVKPNQDNQYFQAIMNGLDKAIELNPGHKVETKISECKYFIGELCPELN